MLLFESPTISGFQFLMGLLGFVTLVGSAIILLFATRKNTVSSVQIQRAEASEALVKTRDTQLQDCNDSKDKIAEELEDVTAELRGQMAINVGELMSYWSRRNQELAKQEALEHHCRILEIRLGDRKE